MATYQNIPGAWVDSDELATTLAQTKSRKSSITMELDISQPPTPDGTGRPANFRVIAPGLYRSSYPALAHFEKLAELKLKTIVTLVPEPIAADYAEFMASQNITHHQIPILANKTPDVCTAPETINDVLKIVFEPANYPLLIHCNKGKHRTGCISACFRRICGWTLEAAIEEYVRYSTPKDRPLDKIFIGNYEETTLKAIAFDRGFVGGVYAQPTSKSSTYTNNTIEVSTDEETE